MIQEKVQQAIEIIDEAISVTPLTRSDRAIIEEAFALLKQLATQGAQSLEARITQPKASLVVDRAGLDSGISNKVIIGE